MSTNDFFANFPKFTHDPSAPISKEFSRLANQRQWRKKSKTWKKQWNRCMNSEYERQIGSTLTGLEAWVALCNEMGLDGPFMSIRQCKKVWTIFLFPFFSSLVHWNLAFQFSLWNWNKNARLCQGSMLISSTCSILDATEVQFGNFRISELSASTPERRVRFLAGS